MTTEVGRKHQLHGMTRVATYSTYQFIKVSLTHYKPLHCHINGCLRLLYMDSHLHTFCVMAYKTEFYSTPIHTFTAENDTNSVWSNSLTTTTIMNTLIRHKSCPLFSFPQLDFHHLMEGIMKCMPLFILLVTTCHGTTWITLSYCHSDWGIWGLASSLLM